MSTCGLHDAGSSVAAFPIAENICRVVANAEENSEYRLLVLEAPPVALAASAGQFFHLACPAAQASDAPFLRRPMSVYRVDRLRGHIQFLYKVQGAGTRGLAQLRHGESLDAFGPLGQGFKLPEGCRHLLTVARGVGLATLAPLAEEAIAIGAAVTCVLSARRPDLVMSASYLSSVGANVAVVTDLEGTSAPKELETELHRRHARAPFDFMATCGSNRLLLMLQRLEQAWGIRGQVALEQHMGCGLGMCFACVRPLRKPNDGSTLSYRRVCWDGPVFAIAETPSW